MKILLATDGSECSEDGARFLKRFNFTAKDEIIILHVISEIPYENDYHAQIRQAIKRVAPKILSSSADILKGIKAGIKTVEKEGYPDTTIIDTAVKEDADMIVMGARGVKGIKLLILGSSTRSVAINSPKPLLVIKKTPRETAGKIKVLFATDGSGTSEAAGRFLTSVPFPDDTEVTVIHAIWSAVSDIPEKFAIEINDRIKEHAASIRTAEAEESAKIIENATAYLRARFADIRGLSKTGDPSTEILNAAKELNADIIAAGCRGLRGLKGMMGSVSRRILGDSECSVLIGKPCAGAD
ncbi:MAG: universal stress protein [Nitrospirota bacterium]